MSEESALGLVQPHVSYKYKDFDSVRTDVRVIKWNRVKKRG